MHAILFQLALIPLTVSKGFLAWISVNTSGAQHLLVQSLSVCTPLNPSQRRSFKSVPGPMVIPTIAAALPSLPTPRCAAGPLPACPFSKHADWSFGFGRSP